MIIKKEELQQILFGACFLASGGGGPIDLGQSCIDANFTDDSEEKRVTKEIFYGTLESIENIVIDGTDVGTLMISGINFFKGQKLKVYTKNENIFANIIDVNGKEKPYIMGPDSICYVPELMDMGNSKVIDNIKMLDVTGLNNLYNCPMKKIIKLHIVAIDAPKHVKKYQNLIFNWCQINQMLGGPDQYTQEWKSI